MTSPAHTESYSVLIVEADRAEAAQLREILFKNFDVEVSHSAQQALTVLRNRTFHVICSNYDVPGMDAIKFLQRALTSTSPPCLLFITDAADARDKQLEGLSGAIVRPYEDKSLLDRVSRLCQVAETRRRVQSARAAILEHNKSLPSGE